MVLINFGKNLGMQNFFLIVYILISGQILLKLEYGVDEYLCFPGIGTKHIKTNGKRVFFFLGGGGGGRSFNATVYIEFRICFTIAKYENVLFSLCETSNTFIGAFCYSKIHFHQSGQFKIFKLIKTMSKSLHVLLGLSSVWNRYPKECYQAFHNRV